VTADKPGSDLVGETAAAMAAASMVFKKSDATYSETLLKQSKALFKFANEHRGTYVNAITDAKNFYNSWSGFGDELAWAAAWLYRATNDSMYKTEAEKLVTEFKLHGLPKQFSWDDKSGGIQVLMAKITGEANYKADAEKFTDYLRSTAPKTPKGMVYLDQWGPARHAASAAFIAMAAAEAGVKPEENRAFAKKQIDYLLGDAGHSFVVGVGKGSPERPHHRASSCPSMPAKCDWQAMNNPGPNPQVLTGALVGGPDQSDNYTDKRDDYVHNEVAMDYNAGFQSAAAGLAQHH
jgi:endoglucanase